MDRDKDAKINIVEYYTMQQMLEDLVSKGAITRREMDLTLERIAIENNLLDALYGCRGHQQELTATTNVINLQSIEHKGDNPVFSSSRGNITLIQGDQGTLTYISLTGIARSHHKNNPSYVIQSWMRDKNTLAFLDLWEQENNPIYNTSEYLKLLEKKSFSSFTVTVKQWVDRTKAIGIISKQGKQGGTFAHPMIACEFATWLSPKFKMLMLNMSQFKDELENNKLGFVFVNRKLCHILIENCTS